MVIVPHEIKEYQIDDVILGEGGFAQVRSGIHLPTNKSVAIKIISKTHLTTDHSVKQLVKEVVALSKCDHIFIAKFYDMFEDDNFFYIVQELASNGSLLESVNARGKLTENQCKRYFSQILSAIEYLHENLNISHRDLKAENILLDSGDNVRLIDLGLCQILENKNDLMDTACGSPAYAAPEVIKGEQYTKSADIWSLGVLLYAIAHVCLPWEDMNLKKLMQKVLYTEPEYSSQLSTELIDLISKMLTKDPKSRITIKEIKEHPWMVNSINLEPVELSPEEEYEIFNDLNRMGYFVNDTKNALKEGKNTKGTVAYQILKRSKLTNKINERLTTIKPKKITVIRFRSEFVKRNDPLKKVIPAIHYDTNQAKQTPRAVSGYRILNFKNNHLLNVNAKSHVPKLLQMRPL
ncbi:CAMK family protein kinase [Tritrichomonas foetus]|uniref:non-specific serine/threonine protein kinase n=1 Tax=Tritrichomonas foetus TaxID=1144522 RepID=A0A1J4K768_9EUKA|nr:CAMK family protein kinase [Tritrichomonas foetus]|eukprot:OHT06752.1 CAMK family protein kinase [Tritrichomonas foetus]